MSESRSCCCGTLPKFWWWLIALLSLPLLFLLMINVRQTEVENDLTKRVSNNLASENLSWASVDATQRGRDIILKGTAATDDEKTLALKTAKAVYGVRVVSDAIIIVPFSSPELSLDLHEDGVTLNGTMPSQNRLDSTLRDAQKAFGSERVNNQLTVGERVAESGWLEKVTALFPVLSQLKNAGLELSDTSSKITGLVHSHEHRDNVLNQARQLLGNSVQDNITVKILKPAELMAQLSEGKITLKGAVANQDEADVLVTFANEKIGAVNVDNQLVVNEDYAQAKWLKKAAQAIQLLPFNGSSLSVTDKQREIQGLLFSQDEKDHLLNQAKELLGNDLVDSVTVKILKPAAVEADVDSNQQKLILKGTLSSQDEVDMLLSDMTEHFGKYNVDNQIQISSDYKEAEWLIDLVKALPLLPPGQSTLSISDETGDVTGTVFSDTKKADLLTKIRDVLGNTIEDNITIKSRKPATLLAKYMNGQLTLQGQLSSQAEIDNIMAVAHRRSGTNNVVNQLSPSEEYKPADWINDIKQSIRFLSSQDGTMHIEEGTIQFTGIFNNEKNYQQMLLQAKQSSSDTGLRLIDKTILQRPVIAITELTPTPTNQTTEVIAEEVNQPAPSEAKTAVEQTQVKDKTETCQQKLNETMSGKTILFETNKAKIKPESYALLSAVIEVVKACKETISQKGIQISGHTDNVGNDQYNQSLSQRRAFAVKTYLRKSGIEGALMKAIGYGESQPVASNNNDEGRAQNRRITFEIQQ